MDDGLSLLLLAVTLTVLLVVFWRIVLAGIAITLISVWMVGAIQIVTWVRGFS